MNLPPNIESKIFPEPNSGCWLWEGALVSGYGFGWDPETKTRVKVHRFVYQRAKGEIPDGLWVLHSCDTPSCVNPDHLFLGSALDNSHDMHRKGRNRQPVGKDHTQAKLTEDDVRLIRASTLSYAALGIQFGVHEQTIYRIRARKRWKSLDVSKKG